MTTPKRFDAGKPALGTDPEVVLSGAAAVIGVLVINLLNNMFERDDRLKMLGPVCEAVTLAVEIERRPRGETIVTPRISELRQAKRFVPSGMRRLTRLGRPAMVLIADEVAR